MVSLNVGCAGTPLCDVRVDVTRKETKANVLADATCLPFKANAFNYVYASNVLEHLPTHPYDSLNELAYVTKPNGVIHIVQPPTERHSLFIEAFAMPFAFAHYIRKGKPRSAYFVAYHLFTWRKRHEGKEGTGYGGHRWYLPWGWKLYCKTFGFLGKMRWKGIHVMWEIFYVKNCVSPDGEEYGLRILKEHEIKPKPEKYVSYYWY